MGFRAPPAASSAACGELPDLGDADTAPVRTCDELRRAWSRGAVPLADVVQPLEDARPELAALRRRKVAPARARRCGRQTGGRRQPSEDAPVPHANRRSPCPRRGRHAAAPTRRAGLGNRDGAPRHPPPGRGGRPVPRGRGARPRAERALAEIDSDVRIARTAPDGRAYARSATRSNPTSLTALPRLPGSRLWLTATGRSFHRRNDLPGRSVGVVVSVKAEASSRPRTVGAGPDVEPDAQPAKRGHRRIARRVDVPAAADRTNPSTPPPGVRDREDPVHSSLAPTTRCCGGRGIVRPTFSACARRRQARRCSPPPLREAVGLGDGSAHACPDRQLSDDAQP